MPFPACSRSRFTNAAYPVESPDSISRSTLRNKYNNDDIKMDGKEKCPHTYPSRTASPNGRCGPDPPRYMSHIWSANVCACESVEKPTWEIAPPRLRVTIFPSS